MKKSGPLVGVLMGSLSDADIMKDCMETLETLEIPHEVKVLSAHRTPDRTRDYALSAMERGIEVIIAGAGWAAHLAGALAAHTTLPVIGIPINSSPLQGMDALLSTVQMPPGIPVAAVSLDPSDCCANAPHDGRFHCCTSRSGCWTRARSG